MNESNVASGSCLCGQVEVHAPNKGSHVGACHCSTCRKWGGGPFMEVNCGTEVNFTGEENITVYNSSEWAERGFCSHCGTHLFYRLKANGEHMVPVGLFADGSGLKFETQVFIDEKPEYYSFADDTEKLTGEELFARFAPPAE